jgi:superfamily II DNA or RNA helicase
MTHADSIASTLKSTEGDTLRPYQQEFLTSKWHYKHVATFDEMGVGKGHPSGTNVLTLVGWVEVQNLQVGDYVVGSDGQPTKVTGIFDRGVIPTYRVSFSDESSVLVDGDHLWSVRTAMEKWRNEPYRTYSTSTLARRGLKTGTNRKWFIPLVQPVHFAVNESLPIDPWLMGVLIGDGSYRHGYVSITKASRSLHELVEQALPEGHFLKPVDNLTSNIVASENRSENNLIIRALKELGVHGQLSYEKVVPQRYLWSTPENRLALLQGLLDSDSEITASGNTVMHTTSSKKLAEQVVFLVQSLGGTAKIKERSTFYTYKGERKEGRTNYRTTINLGTTQLFRTFDKQDKYVPKTKYMPTRAIDSINYVGDEQVYCISVEAEDSLYVTEDFIVTHNTVQCIAMDLVRREQYGRNPPPTLVVAPLTGVIDQWVEEFNKWAPHLRVRRINPKKRELLFKEEADVYIIHPEGLRLMESELVTKQWLHFIFDEVHRIKNRKAKTSKAAVNVGKVAIYRTGATGTPVENMPAEMWHILKWLYPDAKTRQAAGLSHWTKSLLNSYWRFYERFVDYDVEPNYGYHTIKGTKNEQELRDLFGPLYVRRFKKDVQKDLPPVIRQEYKVDLYPKQRKAYDDMKKELLAWVGENEDQPIIAPVVIAQLVRLQQFTLGYGEIKSVVKVNVDGGVRKERIETSFKLSEPSVKLDALMDILDDLGDQQAVVFSTSKQAVYLASARLEKAKIETSVITGDVSDTSRNSAINKFKNGQTQVFLATIRSGGVGLNLQNCNTVVFLDRDWSPAKNQQAIDRVHRGGQKNTVHVIDIVARKTVDQKKDRKLQQKWQWIRDTIGV